MAGEPVVGAAGIRNPQRFFPSLRGGGLKATTLALAEYYEFGEHPFNDGDAEVLLITEKDGVKWRHLHEPRIWVVANTAVVDSALVEQVCQRVGGLAERSTS
ncbi:tetraacyldisaccharide 4'-kinase [Ralstonia solanacearum]|uniref:tetraacyldisaccharide 4'-kinase n=1 Tax=Ralstonia solanacearum TaxID=305 RepID=UPI0024059509|nr:tetraacyldisaccharide 4'-kinase [Ralstonia solanacearum]